MKREELSRAWLVVLHSLIPQSEQEKRLAIVITSLVSIETILVLLALVPAQLWTRLLPDSTSAALDGPFPPVIAPLIPILLYLLPTTIGFLCRSWQRALLCATLPA